MNNRELLDLMKKNLAAANKLVSQNEHIAEILKDRREKQKIVDKEWKHLKSTHEF